MESASESPGESRSEPAPLIESVDGRVLVGGAPLLELGTWRAEGRGSCLLGDFDGLRRWLLQEAELEGRLTFGGVEPRSALRSGALGLGLTSSEWDLGWTVGSALESSASLVGATAAQVHRALERTRLWRHRSLRLAQLNLPLRRLLALAAAVVTDPAIVLLERPFEGLDDEAAQFVETVLVDAIEGRRWIALVDGTTPWERRLCEQADGGVFVARGGRVIGPFEGDGWHEGPRVYWVHVVGSGVEEALRTGGVRVDPGPAPDTWVVYGLSGRSIAERTASVGAHLRELAPLSPAAVPPAPEPSAAGTVRG